MAHREHESLLNALSDCSRECDHCAYIEAIGKPDMSFAAQLCLDTADVCRITSTLVSRGSRLMNRFLAQCAENCGACASECRKFDNEELHACVKKCQHCAEQCRSVLSHPRVTAQAM